MKEISEPSAQVLYNKSCLLICCAILKAIVVKETEEVSQLEEIREIASQKDLVAPHIPRSQAHLGVP
jgi:hypothetical protein